MIYGETYELIQNKEHFKKIIDYDNYPQNLILIPFNFRYEYRQNFGEFKSKFCYVNSMKCEFYPSELNRLIFTYIPEYYIQKAPKGLEHLQLKDGLHLLTAKEWNSYPINEKHFDVGWHTNYKANHTNEEFVINFRLIYWIRQLLRCEQPYINLRELIPVKYKCETKLLSPKVLIAFFEYVLSGDSIVTILPDITIPAYAFNFLKETSLNVKLKHRAALLDKLYEGYSFEQINPLAELLLE